MLDVTQDILDALNKRSRYIKVKVKVYFDSLNPTIYTSDREIIDMDLLQELGADDTYDTGLSANELDLTINNKNEELTVDNKDSSLYGKIIPNVPVEMYYSIELKYNVWADILIGTFYLQNCKPDTSSLSANLLCYDKIYSYNWIPVPNSPLYKSITVKQFFINLLTAAGLNASDYIISDALTEVLNYAWFTSGNLKDKLSEFAQEYECYAYISRSNKLCIIPKTLDTTTSIQDFTDTNQIINIVSPTSSKDIYSAVKLSYKLMQVRSNQELLSLTDIIVPNGNSSLDVDFSVVPVLYVESIQLLGGQNTSLSNFTYDNNHIKFDLTNTGVSETIGIIVKGLFVDQLDSSIEVHDDVLVGQLGTKTCEVENKYVQNATQAQTLANNILAQVSVLGNIREVNCVGLPTLDLGDCINLNSAAYKITEKMSLYRIDTKFDGAFDIKMTFKRGLMSHVLN